MGRKRRVGGIPYPRPRVSFCGLRLIGLGGKAMAVYAAGRPARLRVGTTGSTRFEKSTARDGGGAAGFSAGKTTRHEGKHAARELDFHVPLQPSRSAINQPAVLDPAVSSFKSAARKFEPDRPWHNEKKQEQDDVVDRDHDEQPEPAVESSLVDKRDADAGTCAQHQDADEKLKPGRHAIARQCSPADIGRAGGRVAETARLARRSVGRRQEVVPPGLVHSIFTSCINRTDSFRPIT